MAILSYPTYRLMYRKAPQCEDSRYFPLVLLLPLQEPTADFVYHMSSAKTNGLRHSRDEEVDCNRRDTINRVLKAFSWRLRLEGWHPSGVAWGCLKVASKLSFGGFGLSQSCQRVVSGSACLTCFRAVSNLLSVVHKIF